MGAPVVDLFRQAGTGAFAAGVGSQIHIHMPSQDFSGMEISSDMDFMQLLDRANKKAVADAVMEIKFIILEVLKTFR